MYLNSSAVIGLGVFFINGKTVLVGSSSFLASGYDKTPTISPSFMLHPHMGFDVTITYHSRGYYRLTWKISGSNMDFYNASFGGFTGIYYKKHSGTNTGLEYYESLPPEEPQKLIKIMAYRA